MVEEIDEKGKVSKGALTKRIKEVKADPEAAEECKALEDYLNHYIRDSGLGRLHAIEQETISAAIVRGLGSPRGLM